MKWALGGSYGVCESDILGLMIVRDIIIREGPLLGLMIGYTLGTWVGY